ncbi:hypothetical protein P3S68_019661 [Capsicum galapagoense]
MKHCSREKVHLHLMQTLSNASVTTHSKNQEINSLMVTSVNLNGSWHLSRHLAENNATHEVSGPSGRMSWIRNGPESLGAQNIIEAIDNRNNLRVAKENNILYVAFPAISYGSSVFVSHLKAHHDLQATPARPEKATRLGVRGPIVPAASRTSYSSFWKEKDIFSGVKRDIESKADMLAHWLDQLSVPLLTLLPGRKFERWLHCRTFIPLHPILRFALATLLTKT